MIPHAALVSFSDPPMSHVLGFALKGLRSPGATSGDPDPSSTRPSTSTNTSSDYNTSGVLFGALQVFGSLYSTYTMWMSPPTYDRVCEIILHLRAHCGPHLHAPVHFVRFTASYLCWKIPFFCAKRTGDHPESASRSLLFVSPHILNRVVRGLVSRIHAARQCGQHRNQEPHRGRSQDLQSMLQKYVSPRAPASDEHMFPWIANLASAVGRHLFWQYNEMRDLLFAGI